MSNPDQKGIVIRIEGVRHTFTSLFEPFVGRDGNRSYRDTLLIVPGSEQDKQIRRAINQAAKNQWGDKAGAMIKSFMPDRTKFCYRDGNLNLNKNGDVYAGFEDMWYLAANSKVQPTLKNENNEDIDVVGKASGKLYSGAFVTAIVEIWPQAGDHPGIRCQVQGVRHDRDSEVLGGGGGSRRASDDEFGAAPGKVDDDDSDLLGGDDSFLGSDANFDDDIPF